MKHKSTMLSSQYGKVSTDLKRSFQTALPISRSRNINLEKRTNDSKHDQNIRLQNRQFERPETITRSEENAKKHNRCSKKKFVQKH